MELFDFKSLLQKALLATPEVIDIDEVDCGNWGEDGLLLIKCKNGQYFQVQFRLSTPVS